MKSDSGQAPDPSPSGRRMDAIERAHLKESGDASHAMYRYAPPPEFAGFLERFWIPVWSVPRGEEALQKVLQYPVCLIVITPGYARFYGVVSGLSTTTLTGDGWAVGVMLAPAAGYLLARGSAPAGPGEPGLGPADSVSDFTDRFVDLTEVLGEAGSALTEQVRAAMDPDPHTERSHLDRLVGRIQTGGGHGARIGADLLKRPGSAPVAYAAHLANGNGQLVGRLERNIGSPQDTLKGGGPGVDAEAGGVVVVDEGAVQVVEDGLEARGKLHGSHLM